MPARTQNDPLRVTTATALRREISARNLARAGQHAHETTYGATASVLYSGDEDGSHGNFFPASYRRILANPTWARRLDKAYTASARVPYAAARARSELDCAASSDALLMNVFCHPSALRSRALQALLGLDGKATPEFGVRVRTPLAGGLEDRTEIDMHLGDLLVEAKLSETGFQTGRPDLLARYEAFEQVFEASALPRSRQLYRGYQLVRGVLAAHHASTLPNPPARFAVLADARRPDLREQYFAILSAIRSCDLRSRVLFITWQELAACLPRPLRAFLASKYGIEAGHDTDARPAYLP